MPEHEHEITITYDESGSTPVFAALKDRHWGSGCDCHQRWQAISEMSLEALIGHQASLGNNHSWEADVAPGTASQLAWYLKLGVTMAQLPIKIVEMPPFSKPITLEVG